MWSLLRHLLNYDIICRGDRVDEVTQKLLLLTIFWRRRLCCYLLGKIKTVCFVSKLVVITLTSSVRDIIYFRKLNAITRQRILLNKWRMTEEWEKLYDTEVKIAVNFLDGGSSWYWPSSSAHEDWEKKRWVGWGMRSLLMDVLRQIGVSNGFCGDIIIGGSAVRCENSNPWCQHKSVVVTSRCVLLVVLSSAMLRLGAVKDGRLLRWILTYLTVCTGWYGNLCRQIVQIVRLLHVYICTLWHDQKLQWFWRVGSRPRNFASYIRWQRRRGIWRLKWPKSSNKTRRLNSQR